MIYLYYKAEGNPPALPKEPQMSISTRAAARNAALVAQMNERQLQAVAKLAGREMFTHPEAIRVMSIADFQTLYEMDVIIETTFAGQAGWRLRDSFRAN